MTTKEFRARLKKACPLTYRPRMDIGPVRCWLKPKGKSRKSRLR